MPKGEERGVMDVLKLQPLIENQLEFQFIIRDWKIQLLSCCWQGGTFLWWPKELKIISCCKSKAFSEKIHKAYRAEGMGKTPVFTGLESCKHAPESTGRNLHLTGSRLFCTNPAPVLTQAFKLHLPLPHWNYFELFYARLHQELSESKPNPACTRAPKEAGGGQQLCERTKEPNPNSQPPTGRKEAEPLPWEMRASGTPLSDRSPSAPLPAPALPGEPHCCCCADASHSQTRKQLPALFQLIRKQAAKHRLLQASWKLWAKDPRVQSE